MHRQRTASNRFFGSLSRWCAAILLILATHSPALADDSSSTCGPGPAGTTCGGAAPASLGNTSGTDLGAGNPINVITGNKYQREVDLPALPGELGLEIVRHYNSALGGIRGVNGILGRGWKLSYETELYAIGSSLQIVQADGTRLIFQRDARQPNLCASANPAHGSVTIARTAQGETYTWHWTDGRRLRFNSDGKLVQILAPSGAFVTMQHDSRGLLVKVTDPQWRSLHLTYLDKAAVQSNQRFRGVQTIDSPVGRFSYAYGSAMPKGTPVEPRLLLANLTEVHFPAAGEAGTGRQATTGGTVRFYHYENAQFPTLLTGISIGGFIDGKQQLQRHATFGYDDNGRANLSTHAGDVGKVMLDMRAGGKTVLTNSLGQKTVYLHTTIAGEHRLLEVRGAGCANCGEVNVRYRYDALARLVETIRLSVTGKPWQTVRAELDHYGRTRNIERVNYTDGKADRPQWLIRYTYPENGAPAPTLIARPSTLPGRERLTRISYNGHGQPLTLAESGWAPARDGAGSASPIARLTTYRYASINHRSVLVDIDGPLPNGKSNSPLDSDITRIEYDSRGDYPTSFIAPGNLKNTFRYDDAGRIMSVTNSDGFTSAFQYDRRGQVLAVTRDGNTHSIAYDAFGNPLETGDTDGDGTYRASARFGVDAAGRRVWSASALGILYRTRYDTEDRLIETATRSDAITQTQRYRYDQWGRLLSVTDASGGTRRIAWSDAGLPDTTSDAMGRLTRYRYNAAGQLIAVVEAANTLQAKLHSTAVGFERDALGRARAVVAPNGAATRYLRDDFGQTVAVISPDSGTTNSSFDAAGRLVSATDANGNHATYEYDLRGRIARQRILASRPADPAHAETVTTWRYDGARLTALDHPEQAERYRYDGQGRLSATTVILQPGSAMPLSSTTRYRYDTRGQLASSSLPDGSTLDYVRNGQQQITSIERSVVRTGWLRWLLPARSIVKHIERDAVGLRRFTYGNGIEALHQRSKEGTLARIVYRSPKSPVPQFAALDMLFGISTAHAANTPALPGALGIAPDPAALLDHRYVWDMEGNLLRDQGKDTASNYAYDGQDHLIAAGSAPAFPVGSARFDRYFFDGGGNRLLAQEGVGVQNDTGSNTVNTSYAAASHRWQGTGGKAVQADYDAAGLPTTIVARKYGWDAFGRLVSVEQQGQPLVRYRYNHRGERIGKTVGDQQTCYLYENGKLVAELNASGKITRQYIYLADQAIAIVDTPAGSVADNTARSALTQWMADLATVCKRWLTSGESTAYLHNNHLGATELVTDADGAPLWQAAYRPFGKLAPGKSPPHADFPFNLRLPGQYVDQETGLYYNGQRYYDPQRGQYLSPDPLGIRAGINSYAYVSGNPLKYIDPSGLVLFAFDGTMNDKSDPKLLTNVVEFERLYSGEKYYITGVGTKDEATGIGPTAAGLGSTGDVARAYTGKARTTAMIKYLAIYSDGIDDETVFDIDIVGFSRGAAQGRDFANQIVANYSDGYYHYKNKNGEQKCQKVKFRFIGLFDTVLSTHNGSYELRIPDIFEYAAHAIGLNEYRGASIQFPVESILGAPASNDRTRIERGFLGSHADIGGGFPEQDLPRIAFSWMLDQAKAAGLKMKEWTPTIISNPVIHDKSSNLLFGEESGGPTVNGEDRDVRYGDGTTVKQRKMTTGLMNYTDTLPFITYTPTPLDSNSIAGTVDVKAYLQWLNDHHYDINMTVL